MKSEKSLRLSAKSALKHALSDAECIVTNIRQLTYGGPVDRIMPPIRDAIAGLTKYIHEFNAYNNVMTGDSPPTQKEPPIQKNSETTLDSSRTVLILLRTTGMSFRVTRTLQNVLDLFASNSDICCGSNVALLISSLPTYTPENSNSGGRYTKNNGGKINVRPSPIMDRNEFKVYPSGISGRIV